MGEAVGPADPSIEGLAESLTNPVLDRGSVDAYNGDLPVCVDSEEAEGGTGHGGQLIEGQAVLLGDGRTTSDGRNEMARSAKGGTAAKSTRRVENPSGGILSLDQSIRMLVETMGMTKNSIIIALSNSKPELVCCIKDDAERSLAAKSLKIECPAFDEKRYRALYEQVGKVQTQVKGEGRSRELVASVTGADTQLYRPGQIDAVPIERFSTGFPHLDAVFGYSRELKQAGIPRRFLTAMGGRKGIGKTKLLLHICAHVGKLFGPVLYFQNEVVPQQFAGMIEGLIPKRGCNFQFTSQPDLKEHIALIKRVKPVLTVIDSLQMMDGSRSDAGKATICAAYKQALFDYCDGHGVFIVQLNKKGELKGSTALEHLVDIVLTVDKWNTHNHFKVACEEKNRTAAVGRMATFKHVDASHILCTSPGKFDENMELIEEDEAGELATDLVVNINRAGGVADADDNQDEDGEDAD